MSNQYGSPYRNYSKGGNVQKYPQNDSAAVPDFPDQYVDFAEKQMKEQYRKITTSKLRNLLGILMDVYNTEILRTEQEICADSAVKLQMARIRIAYECGRDGDTRDFVEAMHLLPWLKAIGTSREQTIRYIHYLEAIVAYHRYFGGREN